MNLAYVFEQGNAVLMAVFLLLIGMSVASWYVIFWKAWSLRQEKALLAKLDKGELQLAEVQSRTRELFEAEVAKIA